MATYTYSKATNFNGNFDSWQFHTQITTNENITTSLIGINVSGDVIDIVFQSTLSANEETELNSLKDSYSYNPIMATRTVLNLIPKINTISETTYRRICSQIYRGDEY